MLNPLQGAQGAIGRLLATMGPLGVGITAGAAALVGFGAAWEAAKSTQIKDAELRTGLTAKQVGAFGFAAKAVGQDISIVERLMRGLAQAADDTSREGEKARGALDRMGVDLHTANGELKPTAELLVEISEGLNRIPEGLERDAAALQLFKRVGIEAIPFMTELNRNLQIAHEQGFGPTEGDIRWFQEYQREVAEIETRWDTLVRKFKEGIVITISWAGKGVDWFLNNIGTVGDEERARREGEQAQRDAAAVRAAGGYGASMSRAGEQQQGWRCCGGPVRRHRVHVDWLRTPGPQSAADGDRSAVRRFGDYQVAAVFGPKATLNSDGRVFGEISTERLQEAR